MQAELLMVLTCVGYVAPYAWDRYLRRIWDELLISDEELALRMHRLELPDGSYLNVPARLEFRELSLAENRQLTESLSNATQNAGRSVILTPEKSIAQAWCAPANLRYDYTSGHVDCLKGRTTYTMGGRSDEYPCTRDCPPPITHWPAGTI